MRVDYGNAEHSEASLAANWWTQFARWFAEAAAAAVTEPNAMVLATADPAGRPSSRTVLLKGYDERGLVFFTNYESRKGRELIANPQASVVFPWYPLRRQVVVCGQVQVVQRAESEAYFASRPRESALGAWASAQSTVVPDRAALDAAWADVARRFPPDEPVPTPPFWGGFRLVPRDGGVLAGPDRADARPAALPARRRALAGREAGPVTSVDEIEDPAPTPPAPDASAPTAPARDASKPAAPPPPAGWRRFAIDPRPLRHPAYRRVFVGNAASFFGTQFTAVAVPVQMYALTHSTLWVGLLGLAGLGPLLVFALWGGALADALDRRRLLLVSSTLMWLMTLGLLLQALLRLGSPGLLLVLVAVQSAAVAVAMPTRSAIIPRLVEEDEVAQANTLGYTASTAASVFGPLVAGVIVSGHDVAWAYAVDALSFTVALWATLRLPALPPAHSNGAGRRGGWADVAFGLRYLTRTPVLLLSFAVDIAAMVLAMPRALFPAAADGRFAGAPNAVGLLFAAIALGSVLAGLTSGWIARVRRQGVALVLAVVAWGLAVAASGWVHSLWLAVAFLALGGAADLISAVYRQTILQTYAPDELRGRMQGVFTAVVAGGPRLGDLRAGAMAAPVLGLGVAGSWVIGGIAASVVALVLAVCFPALLRYTPATANRAAALPAAPPPAAVPPEAAPPPEAVPAGATAAEAGANRG